MNKSIDIPIPIYSETIISVFTDDTQTVYNRLTKEDLTGSIEDYLPDSTTLGMVINLPLNSGRIKRLVYFYIDSQSKQSITTTIVHESFHLACNILEYRGIPLSQDSEEAYAYLIEYIFKELNDAYKKTLKKTP